MKYVIVARGNLAKFVHVSANYAYHYEFVNTPEQATQYGTREHAETAIRNIAIKNVEVIKLTTL